MNLANPIAVSHGTPALEWLRSQVLGLSADIFVLCGNHAFDWRDGLSPTAKPGAIVVHPNALHYVPLSNKHVVFVADETEYARQLYEIYGLCRGRGVRRFDIITTYLNGARQSVARRAVSCAFLEKRDAEDALFADALRKIRSWKVFHDSQDFHREAIVDMRTELRQVARSPVNADATLVKIFGLPEETALLTEIAERVRGKGIWYHPSGTSVTFVSEEFSPERALAALKPSIQIRGHRSLAKFYATARGEAMTAPMVHTGLTFLGANADLEAIAKASPIHLQRILRAGLASYCAASGAAPYLVGYDLISFYLDVEFFRTLGLNEFQPKPDRSTLLAYYGPQLGQTMHALASEMILAREVTTPGLAVTTSGSASEIDTSSVDIGQLIYCKSLMLDAFEATNTQAGDPITAIRAGLTASELAQATALDPVEVALCIDALCELEWTTPFNRFTTGKDGQGHVDRCYNTTHRGVVGLVARVIDTLHRQQVPTNLTVLNKCLSFVIQVLLSGKNQKAKLTAEPYKFGKQACFTIQEGGRTETVYLDRFLFGHRSIFQVEEGGGQWRLVLGLDLKELDDGCENLVPFDRLDPQLEKFIQLYRIGQEGLQHPRNQNATTVVDSKDMVAVVVDMFGSVHPESGLRTMAENLSRVFLFKSRDKALRLVVAMQKKLKIFQASDFILGEVHAFLERGAGFDHVERLRERYAYLPGDSQIWTLLRLQLECTANALEERESLKPLGPLIKLMGALSCKDDVAPKEFPKDEEQSNFVVAVTLPSRIDDKTPNAHENLNRYVARIVAAWAGWFGGRTGMYNGNRVHYCFNSENEALGFAGGAWVHLEGLGRTVLRRHAFGVGVSAGRVIRREIGGLMAGDKAPFNPIDRATMFSEISESHGVIVFDVGGKGQYLPAEGLFQDLIVSRLSGLWNRR